MNQTEFELWQKTFRLLEMEMSPELEKQLEELGYNWLFDARKKYQEALEFQKKRLSDGSNISLFRIVQHEV